jgi:hypothetical protein
MEAKKINCAADLAGGFSAATYVIRSNLAQRGKGHFVFVRKSGWFLFTDY